MTAIGKIRSRSGLLITIIGIALIAFVLGDLLKNVGRQTSYDVAVVDGENISYEEYRNRYENLKRQYQSYPEAYLRNDIVDELIREKIMGKEYASLGLKVGDDELVDQFMGENPSPLIKQYFSKEDGSIDRERIQFVSANYPSDMKMLEEQVRQTRIAAKFDNLVKASYFMPTKLAEQVYKNNNGSSEAEVVALRYSKIADSDVEITEADKRKFFQDNKKSFKREKDTRRIEYVKFEIKPSQEDIDEARVYVDKLRAQFALVDSDSLDLFVRYNSNPSSGYDSTWLSSKTVPASIENEVFGEGGEVGKVFGPYHENNAYNIARIVEKQNRPDSLRASHILISYMGADGSRDTVRTKEDAKRLADSLFNVIKTNKKADFAALATQFSSDLGSSSEEKGGDLDWFTDGRMVPAFNEYVVNNPVGSIGLVETGYGYHIIKVTDKKDPQPKVRLAVVKCVYSASETTEQIARGRANDFVSQNTSYEQFVNAADEEGLNRYQDSVVADTRSIPGIDDPLQIVKWAFDDKTKVGSVSQIFIFNDAFVVAAMVDMTKDGYFSMEEELKEGGKAWNKMLNWKKGEIAVKKMEGCGDDYDRMVSELGAETRPVTVKLGSSNLGNFGVEADIVGKIMSMNENATEGPMAGNTSAFIVKNVKHTEASEASDLNGIISGRKAQYTNRSVSALYEAMLKGANVKDNRVRFY